MENKKKIFTRARIRIVAYWFFTLVIAQENLAGSMWDLFQVDYVRAVLTDLHYPAYLLLIIGAWKLPGGIVLLLPRFPRLKEWAYAGTVFNYSGAAASHLLNGDGPDKWVAPLGYVAFAFASWALLPENKRLPNPEIKIAIRPIGWIIPIVIAIVFLVIALLTLPKGTNNPWG
jgi:hypothetical protein